MPVETETRGRPRGLSLLLSVRREWALFVALHAAAALALFGRALAAGDTVVSGELLHAIYPWGSYFARHATYNRDLTDVILQFYPWFLHWAEAVRAGHFPLWNPWSELGLPFAANPITASFSPLTALSLFGGATGWDLLLMARVFFAGLSATFWLRETGRSRGAACAGGLAYALSFPFFGWLQWPHANVNAFFPLLLLLARRLGTRPTRRSAAAFGAVMTLMHLGGHPESVFLDAAAALVVFFATRPRLGGALLFVSGGCLGTLAASVQIVPFLEYLSRSRVWLEPGHLALVLPKKLAASWLVPVFFGRSMERTTWGTEIPFVDRCASAGAVMLALAFVALALAPRARKLLAPALLVAIPIGLAYAVPPFSWLLRLPLFGRVMTHRSLHVAALGLITLGALGWDRLRAARRVYPRRALATAVVPVSVALAALAIVLLARRGAPPALFARSAVAGAAQTVLAAGAVWCAAMLAPLGRRLAAGAVLCGLVLLDSGRTAFPFHGAVRAPHGVFFRTRLTDALAREPAGFRILPLRRAMTPNLNLPYHLASVLAYDAIDPLEQTLFLRSLRAYAGLGLYTSVFPEGLRNPQAARLAGIRLLVDYPTAPPLDTEAFARQTGFALTRIYDQSDGRIYRLEGALPSVSFRPGAERDPGLRRFHELLAAEDPEAARGLFIDGEEPLRGTGAPGTVTFSRPSPERIEARVNSGEGGWVVIAEALDGGWEARVDRARVRIRRANEVLRAVPVPAGTHEVVFVYRPLSLRLGILLSLLGAGALAALGGKRPTGTPPFSRDGRITA